MIIGCAATDFPPLRSSKPAREPGAISEIGSLIRSSHGTAKYLYPSIWKAG